MNDRLGTLRLVVAVFWVAAASTLQAQDIWQGQSGLGGTNWSVGTNWSLGTPPTAGQDVIITDNPAQSQMFLDDGPHTIGLLQVGLNGQKTTQFTINAFTNAFNNALTIHGNNNGLGLLASNSPTAMPSTALLVRGPTITDRAQTWQVDSTALCSAANAVRGVQFIGFNSFTNTDPAQTFTLGGTLTKTGLGNLFFGNSLNINNNGYDIVVLGGSLAFSSGVALSGPSSGKPLTLTGTGRILVGSGAEILWNSSSPGNFNITQQIVISNNATFGFGSGWCKAPISWNGNGGGTVNLTFSSGSSSTLLFTNAPWSGTATINLSSIGSASAIPTIHLRNSDNSSFSGKLVHNGYPGAGLSPVQFMSTVSGSPNAEWSLSANNAVFELNNQNPGVLFGALSGPNGILRNNNASAAGTVTVGALGTSTVFGANIVDGTSPLAFVKVGGGTLTLSGANTFTGGLVVSNGSIVAQPPDSNTPGLGTGPVSIMTNATLLAYGISTNCAVTNYAGGTFGSPGNGTLTLGSLNLGTGNSDVTTNAFNVNLSVGDMVVVTNTMNSLTVRGTSIVNVIGGAPDVGVYTLYRYSGSIGGAGYGGFQLGSLPFGVSGYLSNAVGAVRLVVTNTTANPVVWTGNLSTNWDLSGQLNWKDVFNGSTKAYMDNFDAVFNDQATNFTVRISTNLQPASVTISNTTAHTYTFTGPGAISGFSSLVKDGSGTAILVNSNNTYSGGTFVTNGVLQVGNGGTNGVVPGDPQGVDVGPNAALVFNRSDIISYSGSISGMGSVEQRGPGTMSLSGDNSSWGGNLLVSGGTFQAAAGGVQAFGDLANPVIVTNGGTLDMRNNSLGTKPVTIGGNGALINNLASVNNQTMVRYVTLTGPATFGGDGNWSMQTTNTLPNANDSSYAGVDTYLHGNGYPLTKTGSGSVSLLNVGDTGLSDITVAGGELKFSFLSTLGNSGNNLAIHPGAKVTLSGVQYNNPFPPQLSKNVFMTNASIECIGTRADLHGSITLSGTNNFLCVYNSSDAPFYIYSSITGPGVLSKAHRAPFASTPLIIANSALHTGGTIVSAGLLQVDGTLGSGAATVMVTNVTDGDLHPVPGTLAGNGVINDAVTVQSGGTVTAGIPDGINGGIGLLTVSNSLTILPGGINLMKVNLLSLANDVLSVSGSLTYGGTLTVSNLTGDPYYVGNSFKMFNAGSYLGSFQGIDPATPGAGMLWDTNRLTVDGTLRVVADANLANLVITPAGTLNPPFAAGTRSYTATNAYLNNPVTVTAYASDASATLQLSVNGGAFGPLTSGVASSAQSLVLPTNTVSVRVTSADSSTNQTYTVNVTLQPNLAPSKLTNSLSGSTLTLAWPSDHLGWRLQVQTNTLGTGIKTSGWLAIPGTDLVTQTNFTVIKTNPTVFFRLVYP